MFEALLDINNISTFYTLCGSVILGVTLRFILNWNFEYSLISPVRTSSKIHFQLISRTIAENNKPINHIIVWIIRYIRRKLKINDDEEEGIVYLHPQTPAYY